MKNLSSIVKIALGQVASFALAWIAFFILDIYLDTALYFGDWEIGSYLFNGTVILTFFIGCWGL